MACKRTVLATDNCWTAISLLEAISEWVDEEVWEFMDVEAEGSMEVNTIVLDREWMIGKESCQQISPQAFNVRLTPGATYWSSDSAAMLWKQ